MNIPRALQTAALTLFVSLTIIDLSAQENLPNSVRPGRVEQEFKALRVPKSNAKAFVPGQRNLIAPDGAEQIRFELQELEVIDANAVSTEVLATAYEQYFGKQVSLTDLYVIANQITTLYRNNGYVLSQAIVPAQEINASGVAKIRVVEGYINRIDVTGIDDKKQARIKKITDKIRQSQPLHAKDLERYLLILNDFGGVDFSATLSPSEAIGAADMLLQVNHDNLSGYLSLDNRGTDTLGPERITGNLTIHDMLGRYDSNSLTVVTTGNKELNYLSLNHETPLGYSGWRFSATATASSAKPGDILEPLEIENDSQGLTLQAEYPVIRSRAKNLQTRVQLDFYDSEGSRLGSADNSESLITEDKLRSLRLGLVYDNIDAYRGINLLDIELSQGLDLLGASQSGEAQLSRSNSNPEYSKLQFYAARLQSIVPNWSLLLAVSGQYSNDNLFSSEQFGVGGRNFGSAFDSSEIIGDSGLSGRLELRYTNSLDSWVKGTYTAYAFADGGEIERNTTSAGQPDKESLSSYGIGLRYSLRPRWSGYLEYAVPNNRDVAAQGNDDARLFFSLKSTL